MTTARSMAAAAASARHVLRAVRAMRASHVRSLSAASAPTVDAAPAPVRGSRLTSTTTALRVQHGRRSSSAATVHPTRIPAAPWSAHVGKLPGASIGVHAAAPPPAGLTLDQLELETDAAAWLRHTVAHHGVVAVSGVVLTKAVDLAPFLERIFGARSITINPENGAKVQMYVSQGRRGSPTPARGSDFWHADNAYNDEPAMLTALYCVSAADPDIADDLTPLDTSLGDATSGGGGGTGSGGEAVAVSGPWEAATETGRGDTLFCDMAGAFAALPDKLRRHLATLYAVHDVSHAHPHRGSGGEADNDATQLNAGSGGDSSGGSGAVAARAVHPVVRAHPVTGEPTLYISPGYTERLLNAPTEAASTVSQSESDELLAQLWPVVLQQRHCARVSWQPGTLVVWDNARVMHRATVRHMAQATGRALLRVSLLGGPPRGAGVDDV